MNVSCRLCTSSPCHLNSCISLFKAAHASGTLMFAQLGSKSRNIRGRWSSIMLPRKLVGSSWVAAIAETGHENSTGLGGWRQSCSTVIQHTVFFCSFLKKQRLHIKQWHESVVHCIGYWSLCHSTYPCKTQISHRHSQPVLILECGCVCQSQLHEYW